MCRMIAVGVFCLGRGWRRVEYMCSLFGGGTHVRGELVCYGSGHNPYKRSSRVGDDPTPECALMQQNLDKKPDGRPVAHTKATYRYTCAVREVFPSHAYARFLSGICSLCISPAGPYYN